MSRHVPSTEPDAIWAALPEAERQAIAHLCDRHGVPVADWYTLLRRLGLARYYEDVAQGMLEQRLSDEEGITGERAMMIAATRLGLDSDRMKMRAYRRRVKERERNDIT